MRNLLALVIIALASCAAPSPIPTAPQVSDVCNPLPKTFRLILPAMTVEQVEEESFAGVRSNPSVPQVPFGAGQENWLKLRSKAQPSDKWFKFIAPTGYVTFGGYVALRGTCYIGSYPTWTT